MKIREAVDALTVSSPALHTVCEDDLRIRAEEDHYRLRYRCIHGRDPDPLLARAIAKSAARVSGPPESYVAFVMEWLRMADAQAKINTALDAINSSYLAMNIPWRPQ